VTASGTGADQLVQALEDLGVELVWGLPGVHNLPIWRRLAQSDIRLVGVRHEQTSVYAADGYARATGHLGVALVTTGPGAANTLGATGEAMASGSPVLVIATDIAASLRRPGVYRGALHETRDQPAMFAPVTRSAATVGAADEIGEVVLAAGRLALTAPSGPVYVGVPTDFLAQATALPAGSRDPAGRPERGDADHTDETIVRAAVDVLQHARRPLIWAGGGAVRSGAGPAIGTLACALAAPVLTTYQSRGILPPEHPCAVPASVHAPEVGALWDEADVVLAVGSDLDGVNTQNWAMPAPPTLITVNVDPVDAAKNYPADLSLAGDATPIVERLAAGIAGQGDIEALGRRLKAIRDAVAVSVAADEPEAVRFLDVMGRVLDDDTVVVADMCIPGYWLGGYGRFRQPRKLAFPMGWGTLGFGFPASLGAALAGRGPVVCVCGDGGFLFACGELATVAQEHIPVTVVLVDDGGYGMLRFDQVAAGDEPFGVDLLRPDFAALAASFGVPAVTVDGFGDDFESALASAVSGGQANVIVVRARLKPPLTTSPRWYRRQPDH
jgi:thiamine pyrophosphate-dependent acetolactate synthase large subunit-like protein